MAVAAGVGGDVLDAAALGDDEAAVDCFDLVPVVSFSSNIVQWVLLGGMLMLKAFPQLLLIGIIL